jgi:hypothetical protein
MGTVRTKVPVLYIIMLLPAGISSYIMSMFNEHVLAVAESRIHPSIHVA